MASSGLDGLQINRLQKSRSVRGIPLLGSDECAGALPFIDWRCVQLRVKTHLL